MRGKVPRVVTLFHSFTILIIFLDSQVQNRMGNLSGTKKEVVYRSCLCKVAIVRLILHPWKHTLLITEF
jgi:hypothetical protein